MVHQDKERPFVDLDWRDLYHFAVLGHADPPKTGKAKAEILFRTAEAQTERDEKISKLQAKRDVNRKTFEESLATRQEAAAGRIARVQFWVTLLAAIAAWGGAVAAITIAWQS